MFKEMVSAAVMVLGFATPGISATMKVEFTGNVVASSDMTGLFGLGAGADLNGLAYTLTYIYDTAVGTRATVAGKDDHLQGGTAYGAANPTISAQLTINGQLQSVAGSFGSDYHLYDVTDQLLDQFTLLAQDSSPGMNGSFTGSYLQAIFAEFDDFIPVDLDTPFATNIPSDQLGSFRFAEYDGLIGKYTILTEGELSLDWVTVTRIDVAAVPLPASALLLLAGLGGIGALRGFRNRRSVLKA